MAGAGKKTFVAGEVLTAAQVNDYLMDQAVMRFADASARSASLTAPTEGMVTYLDDTNALYIYDGSAWQIIYSLPTPTLDGQVLTTASAETYGVRWETPSGAGAAIAMTVASVGTTALPATLTAGYYKVTAANGATYTDTQFGFVDTKGQYFGFPITTGTGLGTIPVDVASVNVTTNANFFLLAEEVAGVTATLIDPPIVTDFEWSQTQVGRGNASFTVPVGATSIGVYNVGDGDFTDLSSTASTAASFVVSFPVEAGADTDVVIVAKDVQGIWSTASAVPTATFATESIWGVYTANATLVKPPWSASLDVVVVAGGGGSGGISPAPSTGGANANRRAGGGGAGGAAASYGYPFAAPVGITIGAGGTAGVGAPTAPATTAGGTGGNTAFSAITMSGGGGGGRASSSPNAATPGGSGGGGGSTTNHPAPIIGAGAAGTPGQGTAGANGTSDYGGGGGGKSASGSAPGGGAASVVWGINVAQGGDGGSSPGPGATATVYGGGGGGGARLGSGEFSLNGKEGNAGVVIVKLLT